MLLIAGTVPVNDLPLTMGKVRAEAEFLMVNDYRIPCTQGTGAMIGAALVTTDYLNLEAPEVLALHYCLPNMSLTRKLCDAIKGCSRKPVMIADAASMYAAKAAGLASEFDIFTPDATEMAFLADRDATHPAYITRHLFDTDITQTPKLVAAAYQHQNAAKLLLVKGAIDYVARNGDILTTITEPNVPELEAIGGTGDTITGLVSSFVYAGLELPEAAIIAAKANRMAGKLAQATPATKVGKIINYFPAVFKEFLCQWSEVCQIEEGDHNG